jgi:hypothetical protein
VNNSKYELNFRQLLLIAEALSDLLPRVVFVGGCTTVLLVDEVAYSGVRQTEDVDVIVDLSTYMAYHDFGDHYLLCFHFWNACHISFMPCS